MTETYTNGMWTVKAGEEDALRRGVDEPRATGGRRRQAPGPSGSCVNVDEPERYMSFADWESFDAQKAWKSTPEFVERMGRVRSHCTELPAARLRARRRGSTASAQP